MTNKAHISLTPFKQGQYEVIFIKFGNDPRLTERLKLFPNNRWSSKHKSWYVLREDFNLQHFFEAFTDLAFIDYSALKKQKSSKRPAPNHEQNPHRKIITLPPGYLEKLEQKRYSKNTINTYCHYFRDFQKAFKNVPVEDVDVSSINAYLLKLVKQKNISQSQQNQHINAIKFYYEKVLGKEKTYYGIDRPRREIKLPEVLSKEEVGAMISATTNIKHKCIIALIYSCGLRRSEVINLKLEDIDSKRMLIRIRAAKGKKDRYVQLAKATLRMLRTYYRKEKPAIWVFEGIEGKQYSATSIFNVIKNAAKKAGIRKRVYPHILRHSFATHHLEQGTGLRYIQELLGHASSKTTEVYTHVSRKDYSMFKNPIDDIVADEH